MSREVISTNEQKFIEDALASGLSLFALGLAFFFFFFFFFFLGLAFLMRAVCVVAC